MILIKKAINAGEATRKEHILLNATRSVNIAIKEINMVPQKTKDSWAW